MPDDLDRLLTAPADHLLDRLEGDVWRGVRRADAARSAGIASAYQVGMLTCALLIGVTTGAGIAYSRDQPERVSILMLGDSLAPSTLLLGQH